MTFLKNSTTSQEMFLNRLRSLFNIDGHQLPELALEERRAFTGDPVGYLISASDAHADAIWREVEKRQHPERRAAA